MNQIKPLPHSSEDAAVSTEQSTFGDILSQFEQSQAEPAAGQTLEGTVVAVSEESVFVDIGRKMEGVIPAATLQDASGKLTVDRGTKLLVNVTGNTDDGYYRLSTIKVERPKDWSELEAAFADKRTIAGTVQAVIKGGLQVDVAGTRAFMPASRSGARDQAEMEKLVGQEIQCRITKLDAANDDLVVDRRVVLEEEAAQAKEKRFAALQEGDVLTGTVRSLTDFGAFIDLGGVDGLLHVTDMAWTRTNKPSDLLTAGESVQVKILKINANTRKISLGMKQLVPDPWSVAGEKYNVGDRVTGTVARLTDFGAFVELAAGVDGLIHISEMSWSKKFRKPSDILKVGEQVEAVVLTVNLAEHRIALGLKQALGDPWDEAEKKYSVGAIVDAPVTNLAKFGAFVDLGGGIEGMIHIADITREKRLEHPKEMLNAGQTIRAQVLEVDRERRRIRLGMKQLEPTSADQFIAEHQPGETVSGRILEVSNSRARVELGEGVVAVCRFQTETQPQGGQQQVAEVKKADLSTSIAMLTAKWKQGSNPEQGGTQAPRKEPIRAGQVRTFRILTLNPEQKKIEVELAS